MESTEDGWIKAALGAVASFTAVALMVGGALAGGHFVAAVNAQDGSTFDQAQACSDPDQAVTLYAQNLKRGRIGYGLTPETASVPGPTLQMVEGECVAITVVNNASGKVSFHPHGVDYTVRSDGTPINASCVKPGGTRTYVISSHAPGPRGDGTIDPGSAGYWHYHDHCMGTPHGTGGIAQGLFGALIVRRAGDPLPDREPFVVVMGPEININDRLAPSRKLILEANEGERVEFVVIGHGDFMHTFHLHGHRWSDNRTGMPAGVSDPVATIDNKTVGAADSFGFQVIAGEHVGQGAWMYHCHMQNHSDLGMSGLFVVRAPDGTMNDHTSRAIERWIRLEKKHRQHM